MTRIRATFVAGGLVAAAALAALPAGASAGYAATSQIPGCTPRTNIEAIVDDSGSMDGTDPQELRRDALASLIQDPGNNSVTLGAVEFGTGASPLFAPQPIGAGRTGMLAALNALIQSNNGSTNYNDAFVLAQQQNPNATGRIFLTDGGHNVGPYANPHVGGPPTYVIGFSNITDPADEARLQQIATDTKGRYFPRVEAGNLTPTLTDIESALFCRQAPLRYVDTFARQGQQIGHAKKLSRSTRTVNFRISWRTPGDSFDISALSIRSRGQTVAEIAGRRGPKRLKVTRTSGPTFVNVRVRGLRPGSMRFKVRAKKLTVAGVPQVVTTQLSQSRSR